MRRRIVFAVVLWATLPFASVFEADAGTVQAVESVKGATLYAWYKAAESETDDEGTVVRLSDRSGNERHLFSDTQSAGPRPRLVEDPVIGKKLTSFAGAQYLQSNSEWGVLEQPSTIVIASRISRTSGGYLFDSRYSSEGRQAFLAGDGARVSRWQMWAGSRLVDPELATTHHVQVHTLVFNGDASRHYVDGEEIATGATGTQPLAGLTVGARFSLTDGHFLHGEIGEMILFEGVLPTAEREAVEQELTRRYLPRDLVDVFISGEDGYHTYRIPVLFATSRGTLLAFAEGRSRRSDQSKNDIVLRRSVDGGESWEPLILIADQGDHSLNDPTVVQERESGRIFLFFHRYPFGHHAGTVEPGFEGEGVHRAYITYSDDDGKTWVEPEEISRSVKRSEQVTYLGSGPGIGIQLERGPYAERLVIPFRERAGVFAVFSDDAGETWQIGELAQNISPGSGNEPQMVELDDGRVMLNARNAGGNGYRKVAISDDGGSTWGEMWHDRALIEPECQAGLIRFPSGAPGGDDLLLFINPATREKGDGGRRNGLLRASFDDGQTWPIQRVVYPGQFSYSTIAQMNEEDLGILFERDFGIQWLRQAAADHGKDPMRISFRKVDLAWLLEGDES